MASEPSTAVDPTRVWTLPNVLSFLRLVGVPVFFWLVVDARADVWAVVLLMAAGATDWLDGFLARRWNQVTRLGQLLDPIADRLYILAIVSALAIRHLLPWWFVGLLVGRELLLVALWPALRSRGLSALPVHFLGKAATFALLYAFPLVLLGAADAPWATGVRVIGWAGAIWGLGLYWWAGLLYLRQTIDLVRQRPAGGAR